MPSGEPIVSTTQREQAIATITAAFITDPLVRFIYPDAATYLSAMPRVVAAFGGAAIDNGTAYAFPTHNAVALWMAPGVHPDNEAMGEIMGETVDESIQVDMGPFMEQMGAFHPHEPHWYLPFIGVDPAYQGRGLGGALLTHTLAICDEARLPAYLEATSEGSKRLYERHGFVTLGEIQSGATPTIWPMRREPRG